MTDCWIDVDGDRFADTAADYHAGTPTALADVEITWGRATTVDQPEAATARVTVLDRSGGTGFVDALPIGVPIDVWASGDVSTGAWVDVAVDGGFETLTVGPAGPRVEARNHPNHSAAPVDVVAGRAYAGTQSLDWRPDQIAGHLIVPPAAFDPSPTAWDSIPTWAAGARWSWSIAVRPGPGVTVEASAMYVYGPQDVGAYVTEGPALTITGDGAWHIRTGEAIGQVDGTTVWLGVMVRIVAWATWTTATGTWAEATGTWTDHGRVEVDAQKLWAPPDALVRRVLVFSGRITDLSASVDGDGTIRVDVTAVDQLADLQNRYVGDQPWTMERFDARVARIVNLSGAAVDTRIDPALAPLQVTRRDVDSQPAAGLLAELTAGVDGVLWSATHESTGPYLWIEDVARRAVLATLALQGGVVVIVIDPNTDRPPGRTVIDGTTLPQGEVTWVRDVTDVLTRVDGTWKDQTTQPETTERNVRVVDAAAEASGSVFRIGVTTPLTNATDATNVCERILARTRKSPWRTEGLTYDAGLTPPEPGPETGEVLDLLDGTIRIGRGIVVTNVERWPGGSTAAYLDGGRYAYDGAWVLQFVTTPWAGVVDSGPWTSLDPAWAWNQFDPAIAWADMYGVTGPITTLEGA